MYTRDSAAIVLMLLIIPFFASLFIMFVGALALQFITERREWGWSRQIAKDVFGIGLTGSVILGTSILMVLFLSLP